MSGERPAYRPMRWGRVLEPPPPTDDPDSCFRTHRQVRRYGERACHEVLEEQRYGYVTRCGLRIFKDGAMRTWRRQWCGHGCGEKRERAEVVDIPPGPSDSVDRQKNTRCDGTGKPVRDTANSPVPQTVRTAGVTSDGSRAAESGSNRGPGQQPGAQRPRAPGPVAQNANTGRILESVAAQVLTPAARQGRTR